jgi:hypothetical protein
MAGKDQYFDLGDVVLSTAEKGQIRVNLGDVDRKTGYGVSTPVWGPDGYLARPNDPKDGACRALYLTDGQNRRVLATSDNRFAAQAGTLEPGDRMIVSSGDARFYLRNADNRIGVYTEAKSDPPVGGKGMIIEADGEAGLIRLRAGGAVIELDAASGTITLTAAGPSGKSVLVLSPTEGAQIMAGGIHLDTLGFVTLGLNSDQTRPGKPGADNVLIGAIGQSGVMAPKCNAAQY